MPQQRLTGESEVQAAAAAANSRKGKAPYTNGHANGKAAAASSGKASGGSLQASGNKENAPDGPPALNLAMCAEAEARARKELRLTKEQVCNWTGLHRASQVSGGWGCQFDGHSADVDKPAG